MDNAAPHPKDLAGGLGTALATWGTPFAIVLLTGWLDVGAAWKTLAWTLGFGWAGAACLFNASRSGRLHCHITGPYFLLLAGTALSYGLGLLPLGPHGWRWIGVVALAGGCLLKYVPEWIWGTYREPGRDQCC